MAEIYFYNLLDISSTVQQQYYRTDGRVVKALASGASHASGVGSSPTLFTITFADLIGSFCGSVRLTAFSALRRLVNAGRSWIAGTWTLWLLFWMHVLLHNSIPAIQPCQGWWPIQGIGTDL
jgi:hypothetical protein